MQARPEHAGHRPGPGSPPPGDRPQPPVARRLGDPGPPTGQDPPRGRRGLRLEPLLTALQDRDSATAVAWIDDYLKRATALTIATDQEIAFLRLTLRGLEYQVTALSDDKAEIERLIHAFSLRSSHEIGDLITRYLELRAEKLRRQAAVEQDAERKPTAPAPTTRSTATPTRAPATPRSPRNSRPTTSRN